MDREVGGRWTLPDVFLPGSVCYNEGGSECVPGKHLHRPAGYFAGNSDYIDVLLESRRGERERERERGGEREMYC